MTHDNHKNDDNRLPVQEDSSETSDLQFQWGQVKISAKRYGIWAIVALAAMACGGRAYGLF